MSDAQLSVNDVQWEELKPVASRGPGVEATVRIRVNLQGVSYRSILSFPKELWPAKVGDRCRVLFSHGQLLVRPVEGGHFRFSKGPSNRLEIRLPMFAGVPEHVTSNLPCQCETCADGSVIVTLPEDMPEHEPRLVKRGAPAKAASAPPPDRPWPAAQKIEPINVVGYLTKHGHGVSRIAGGRWAVDGDAYTIQAVLSVVNRHRKAANLPPAKESDLI